MSCVINIQSIKINAMASNASLNIGPAFHSKHSAVTHAQGSNVTNGDRSPAKAYMHNTLWSMGNEDQTDSGDDGKEDNPWKIGSMTSTPTSPTIIETVGIRED